MGVTVMIITSGYDVNGVWSASRPVAIAVIAIYGLGIGLRGLAKTSGDAAITAVDWFRPFTCGRPTAHVLGL